MKTKEKLNLCEGLTYGRALCIKREELGLSKKEFASKLDINVYKLAKWEEDIDVPTAEEKALINNVLGADVFEDGFSQKTNIQKKIPLSNEQRIEELEIQVKNLQEQFSKIDRLLAQQFKDKPKCPNCGSHETLLGQRGTSGMRRFVLSGWADIGATDLWYTCLQCDYRWPK